MMGHDVCMCLITNRGNSGADYGPNSVCAQRTRIISISLSLSLYQMVNHEMDCRTAWLDIHLPGTAGHAPR